MSSKIKHIKRIIEFWLFQRSFSQNFSLYTTDDRAELQEIFNVRYHVYCEEYGYLDKNIYPNKMESDEFDKFSIQFVLRTKKGELAASVRLILHSPLGFPIEKHTKIDIYLPAEKSRVAEVSRLIVARKFRKKFLLLALIKGLFVYTNETNISHVYSILDDRLFPILKDMGFPFKRIGPSTIYQGLTSPYILDVAEAKELLHKENPRLFRFLINGTARSIENSGQYSIS